MSPVNKPLLITAKLRASGAKSELDLLALKQSPLYIFLFYLFQEKEIIIMEENDKIKLPDGMSKKEAAEGIGY